MFLGDGLNPIMSAEEGVLLIVQQCPVRLASKQTMARREEQPSYL